MLFGALIGVIVAIIAIAIKKNMEKKALKEATDGDLLDTPDYAAFFHYASEETFGKKGFRFFDTNGALTIHGTVITYKPQQKNKGEVVLDITKTTLKRAPEKRKMKWLEIDDNGKKHYFTSFSQNAFNVDKSEMDRFLRKLAEIRRDLKQEPETESQND